MAWIILVGAGFLEVGWASVMPATHGFSRPLPTAAFVVLLAASMFGLAKASETIPLGTAYAVWVGIGALGTVIVGIVLHGDPATPSRLAFLALLVASVVGLNLTGSH